VLGEVQKITVTPVDWSPNSICDAETKASVRIMNNTRRLAAGLLTAALTMGVLPAPVLADASSGEFDRYTSSFENSTPSYSDQLRSTLRGKGWGIEDSLEYVAWQNSKRDVYPTQSGWYEDDLCMGCRFAPLPAPDGVAAFVTLVPRAEFGTFMRNMPPGEGRAIGVEVVDPPNSDYIYVYEAGYSS
jgi:hypothetical protein